MRVRKYEVILKVAENNSFTKTADYFHYTQSAISHMVRSAEEELGVNIFHRTPTGIFLTDEGKEIIPLMQKINNDYRTLDDTINNIHQLGQGNIKLGAYISLFLNYLPNCIQEFQKKYPNISFELFPNEDDILLDKFSKGHLDLLLISDPKKSYYKFTELYKDPLVVISPKDHWLADRTSVSLKELKDEEFIGFYQGYDSMLLPLFKSAGYVPKTKYPMLEDIAALAMVEQNHGITIMAEFVAYKTHRDVNTCYLESDFYRTLGIVTRKNDPLSWAISTFIDFIKNEYPIMLR